MGYNGAGVHRGRTRQNITRESYTCSGLRLSGVHLMQVENPSYQSQVRVYERKE